MATKQEIERLAVVETKVDNLAADVQDIKSDIKSIRDAIENGVTVNDKRYAAKWVQSALTYVIALILTAVIGAVIALVIIPSQQPTQTTQVLDTKTTN